MQVGIDMDWRQMRAYQCEATLAKLSSDLDPITVTMHCRGSQLLGLWQAGLYSDIAAELLHFGSGRMSISRHYVVNSHVI